MSERAPIYALLRGRESEARHDGALAATSERRCTAIEVQTELARLLKLESEAALETRV